jgi:hypothetical protein
MKAVRNSLIENIRHIPARSKHSLPKTCPKTVPLSQPLPACPLRTTCVEWLYRAQRNLQFSRSTLFIALGLLDKLLLQGLALTHDNYELVAGSILLASTKFNEVYPVTIRKLNVLSEEEHSLQQFVEAEAAILQNIEFTVTLDPAYEQLAELETQFEGVEAENLQELIKMAVINRNETFKHGLTSLTHALNSLASEGGLLERNGNTSGSEIQEIRKELTRLRSASQKRLVSPGRA